MAASAPSSFFPQQPSAQADVLARATAIRRAVWQGSVPVRVRIAEGDLPPGSSGNGDVDAYFLQAPRQTYLALLLPDIREYLLDLVLDEASLTSVGAPARERDWWLEDARSGGAVKWHWPIGLLYDHATINAPPSATPAAFPPNPPLTLELILHLSSPPTDKLLLANSAEACKTAFMSAVKEADFIRWGNVRRVTGLRRGEQDALWEAVRQNDFELHSKVAQRLLPLPFPPPPPDHSSAFQSQHPPPSPNPAFPSRPPSTEPGQTPGGGSSIGMSGSSRPDAAFAVRSVPCKVILPEGAAILQDLTPPFSMTGHPTTLLAHLQHHLPLLFPPEAELGPNRESPDPYKLAYPLIQGIIPPPESELAWLGACLVGADGWVTVCVGLR